VRPRPAAWAGLLTRPRSKGFRRGATRPSVVRKGGSTELAGAGDRPPPRCCDSAVGWLAAQDRPMSRAVVEVGTPASRRMDSGCWIELCFESALFVSFFSKVL